ncbi:MAG: RelA/SpoT domain-containing protein [Synergistota bacterium]|nr:RelA/SpoT domain-containing protein [Synergistota bacterium]
MNATKADELGKKYMQQYSLYREFATRASNLLESLVEQDGIQLYSVSGEAKPTENFLQSFDPQADAAPTSLTDIADLCCVKVLVHFPEDVEKVEKVIHQEFLVDMSRSMTSSKLDDPDRFGYPAVYYTLSLNQARASMREWSKYKDLPFSLEVRTVIQEAWAANTPKLMLPTDASTKRRMQRKLFRVGALLEEADEGYYTLWESARESAMPVTPPVVTVAPTPAAKRVFDRSALRQYFQEHEEIPDKWAEIASEVGFPAFKPDAEYLDTSLSYLWDILRAAEMDSPDEFQRFIDSLEREEKGREQIATVYKAFEREAQSWRVDGYSALFLLVLNLKWDVLQNKDLVELNVKRGSDRIKGIV